MTNRQQLKAFEVSQIINSTLLTQLDNPKTFNKLEIEALKQLAESQQSYLSGIIRLLKEEAAEGKQHFRFFDIEKGLAEATRQGIITEPTVKLVTDIIKTIDNKIDDWDPKLFRLQPCTKTY